MSRLAVLSEKETIRLPVGANTSTYFSQEPSYTPPVEFIEWLEALRGAQTQSLVEGAQTQSLVQLDEAQAEWKKTVEELVDGLAALEPGWDSYAAPAIDPQVISETKLFVGQIATPGTPAPAVVPTVNGTIQLEWHTRSTDTEVEILEPGRYYVFASVVAEQPWEGEATHDEAITRIQQVLTR